MLSCKMSLSWTIVAQGPLKRRPIAPDKLVATVQDHLGRV